ncbi:hypothetical protein, partial [Enterococcus cecorum]|uniref:hypothetical protein n=1 Tax=Enterococcus cecorum TaxID=44008 RepID=UPI001FAB76BE
YNSSSVSIVTAIFQSLAEVLGTRGEEGHTEKVGRGWQKFEGKGVKKKRVGGEEGEVSGERTEMKKRQEKKKKRRNNRSAEKDENKRQNFFCL